MRGAPTTGGSEAYFTRTSQRSASARGTRPQDGHLSEWVPGRWTFFSSLLVDESEGQSCQKGRISHDRVAGSDLQRRHAGAGGHDLPRRESHAMPR